MNTAPTNHYLLHVYEDKDHKVFIKCPPLRSNNRKQAIKKMREYMHEDLVNGKYYFYVVTEQRNTIIDYAPNHETTD
jgi:hypothetical protein